MSREHAEQHEHHELRATYRMQLHPGFGFDAAAGTVDYLAALGVSHLYSSPSLQAAPGSTHGYDVVDPKHVNRELGGAEAYSRLHEALTHANLGNILDIVPNHMAIGARDNAWWWDVLENGPASRYARYFDVDWDPPEAKLRNTVLLPILGDHYGRVLEARQITLTHDGGSFTLRYFEHSFPVAPRALDVPLAIAADRCKSDELAFIANAFGQLPPPEMSRRGSDQDRHRDKEVLRTLLANLCERDPHVAEAIDTVLAQINADTEALDEFLERQNYRLSFWRAAERELGYRRFFDINSLAGIRAEDERVFADTHELILRWLDQNVIEGVRIDHVDGLRDPAAYLQRLRDAAPEAWIVVEKILEPGERLPAAWPIAGTSGYDFLNSVGGLFVDPAGEMPLTSLYAEFTGPPTDYPALVREKKHLVLRETLGSDVIRLTALWLDICQRHWRYRDYTRHELQEVLREVIVTFPVYRTYVQAEAGSVREDDLRIIVEAIETARRQRPDLDSDLFSFLADLLLLRTRGDLESELVMRFQQLTGPAMAKGAEDTAFYCYNRLVSLNEVGGDPAHFGTSVEAFHAACTTMQLHWPQTMLTTSTHDVKRSEDVRARICLLSEIPDHWGDTVRRWAEHNERHRSGNLPDRNAEYLLYQTLVGAWPIDVERATAYMEKAAREAKLYTSWTEPQPDYERALRTFVESALADDEFVADVQRFVDSLTTPGWITSLAQTLLKLTAPGVPDIYQGTEIWNLSLVDPDNRRPVDYDLRRRLLTDLEGATIEDIWARRDEGLPKLWLIRQALALRQRRPELFGPRATYLPLAAQGTKAAHVVAFVRTGEAVTVTPRLVLNLGGDHADWADTTLELPPGRWHNELTGDTVEGGTITLADLLRRFPVALLAREDVTA
ncbi:MAG: malto-oligosyltrehalose synthase [Ktedonobacterales bacterium]